MDINKLTIEDFASMAGMPLSAQQKRFARMCEAIHNEGKRVVIVSDRRNRCFIMKGEPIEAALEGD